MCMEDGCVEWCVVNRMGVQPRCQAPLFIDGRVLTATTCLHGIDDMASRHWLHGFGALSCVSKGGTRASIR